VPKIKELVKLKEDVREWAEENIEKKYDSNQTER